jgi:hypothetical protein
MTAWMTFWTILLIGSCATFAGMLVLVGMGALGELRQTLDDLRRDTLEASQNPELLDKEY